MHNHSYIYMFLDKYNCRVCLGVKWDFRCEVSKYEKTCTEKYLHKPPFHHPSEPREKIETMILYKQKNFICTFLSLLALRVWYTKIHTYHFTGGCQQKNNPPLCSFRRLPENNTKNIYQKKIGSGIPWCGSVIQDDAASPISKMKIQVRT